MHLLPKKLIWLDQYQFPRSRSDLRAGLVQLVYTLGARTHTCSCSLGTGSKGPRREADHSPPSNAAIKNTWSNTSTPTI